jgi:hypothetical protein
MNRLIIVSLLCLSGCAEPIEGTNIYEETSRYYEVCINGVVYYQNGHKLAPKFNINGTLYPCGVKND